MKRRIITIGREFGSGGRELGRRLSEKLQLAYYDREIVTELANRTSLSEEYVERITSDRPFASYPIHIGTSFYALPDMLWTVASAYMQSSTDCLKSFP